MDWPSKKDFVKTSVVVVEIRVADLKMAQCADEAPRDKDPLVVNAEASDQHVNGMKWFETHGSHLLGSMDVAHHLQCRSVRVDNDLLVLHDRRKALVVQQQHCGP
eukprot:TRINITY_DN22150_c0_g1_i1.p5 TRINITY_DN22150_c0_g1~~TRINITY_DN22150_c0_g1_i1.p5  ORF type:complete len:105 (-),score=16.33 TRINITY_DN22150_c0_g1_i1:2148-2462(-)